jgi:hypothetical protein
VVSRYNFPCLTNSEFLGENLFDFAVGFLLYGVDFPPLPQAKGGESPMKKKSFIVAVLSFALLISSIGAVNALSLVERISMATVNEYDVTDLTEENNQRLFAEEAAVAVNELSLAERISMATVNEHGVIDLTEENNRILFPEAFARSSFEYNSMGIELPASDVCLAGLPVELQEKLARRDFDRLAYYLEFLSTTACEMLRDEKVPRGMCLLTGDFIDISGFDISMP